MTEGEDGISSEWDLLESSVPSMREVELEVLVIPRFMTSHELRASTLDDMSSKLNTLLSSVNIHTYHILFLQ